QQAWKLLPEPLKLSDEAVVGLLDGAVALVAPLLVSSAGAHVRVRLLPPLDARPGVRSLLRDVDSALLVGGNPRPSLVEAFHLRQRCFALPHGLFCALVACRSLRRDDQDLLERRRCAA